MSNVLMTLQHLPAEASGLPDGYRLRPFAPGDRDRWVAIQASTGAYETATADLFDRAFGVDPADHEERIMFAVRDGEAVGVSAAWHPASDMPPSVGRVHWVAVEPAHQRRGLGRALVGATLARLHELGYESAYLTTGSDNRRAVHLYLSLGFEPVARSREERLAWERLGVRTNALGY